MSHLNLCATSKGAGGANDNNNNSCMSLKDSIKFFPIIISFDAQVCPCEGGMTGALISIF